MKRMKKLVSVLLAACSMLLLVACSSKPEDKLVGTWHDDWDRELTFYEDGTYTKYNEYGTGKWSIISENKLKMVDYYGITNVITYEVDGESLTCEDDSGDVDTYSKE